jgi:hypothetical protein
MRKSENAKKMKEYISGILDVIDFMGLLEEDEYLYIPMSEDSRSLKRDWDNIGNDLRGVLEKNSKNVDKIEV